MATGSKSSSETKKVVLVYSGGLDTSVAIGWIGEQTGREVVAVAVDVGQGGEDLQVIRRRALDCGAVEAFVVDAREEFAADFCMPALLLQTAGLGDVMEQRAGDHQRGRRQWSDESFRPFESCQQR